MAKEDRDDLTRSLESVDEEIARLEDALEMLRKYRDTLASAIEIARTFKKTFES